MTTAEEMAKFVVLWDLLQDIQLTNQPDCIRWKWTASGEYTSKSAYRAQLQGRYSNIQGKVIRKAHAEA